jgi:hypothetical protein
MSTKTYYAKLNCISNPVNKEHIANEQYKSFMDFMSFLTGSGVAELISWNSGSGAVSGSFNTRTYWDGTRPFGLGAHSLWKMTANANRPWDWYMYLQLVSGSATVAAQTFNQPIVSYNSANFAANSNLRGVAIQTAVCFSGSTSFNPWNGTISDGNSTAANPRWASGSLDRTMYIFPRSNDLGGSHTTSRNNSVAILYASIGTTNQTTDHFIYDGDALYVGNDLNLSRTIRINYNGAFDLNPQLSGSGICGGTKGFMAYLGTSATDTVFTNTAFGDTAGTAGDPTGGVGVPIGIMVSGSRTGVLQTIGTFPGSSYQPNYIVGEYDEFPIYVGVAESPYVGFLGNLSSGFINLVVGPQSYHISENKLRAVVGGNLVPGNRKATIPWTGSYAPGYIASPREGYTYTWTQDYG